MSIAKNFPTTRPLLNQNLANVKALDPRVTFDRVTSAAYHGTETAKVLTYN